MMMGWRICRERMRLEAAKSGELLAALRANTMVLPEFTTKHASLWRNYASARDSMETMNRRHHLSSRRSRLLRRRPLIASVRRAMLNCLRCWRN